MTARPQFDEKKISPRALAAMSTFQAEILNQIATAIESNDVVVVGMAHNPFVKKARKALDVASVKFTYLEYGNYFNSYTLRVAIKMWTGWPTFPQIFVKGVFIGGADDLLAEIAEGTFQKRLSK